jgi:hypothetical protein
MTTQTKEIRLYVSKFYIIGRALQSRIREDISPLACSATERSSLLFVRLSLCQKNPDFHKQQFKRGHFQRQLGILYSQVTC